MSFELIIEFARAEPKDRGEAADSFGAHQRCGPHHRRIIFNPWVWVDNFVQFSRRFLEFAHPTRWHRSEAASGYILLVSVKRRRGDRSVIWRTGTRQANSVAST